MVAMGALPARMPWLERAARWHLRLPRLGILPKALALAMARRPELRKVLTTVLYATLGKALPDGAAAAAVVWGSSRFYAGRYARQVRRAGHAGSGAMLGEALFRSILDSDTAVPISTHEHDEVWELVRHPDRRIHLAMPEMLGELEALADEPAERPEAAEFPFVLAAGERRSYNANQIYRDPAWRRSDREGALRIHPEDADRLGLADGQRVVCESAAGAVEARLAHDDSMLPGSLSLPHGYGQEYPDPEAPEDAAADRAADQRADQRRPVRPVGQDAVPQVRAGAAAGGGMMPRPGARPRAGRGVGRGFPVRFPPSGSSPRAARQGPS